MCTKRSAQGEGELGRIADEDRRLVKWQTPGDRWHGSEHNLLAHLKHAACSNFDQPHPKYAQETTP